MFTLRKYNYIFDLLIIVIVLSMSTTIVRRLRRVLRPEYYVDFLMIFFKPIKLARVPLTLRKVGSVPSKV